MPLFYWNARLETGNAQIDAQHRHLFDLTNHLADLLADGGALPEVTALVERLRAYAEQHFCNEESFIACSALSDRQKRRHVCAHRDFLARVDRIAASDLGDEERLAEFLDFLVTWLVAHILKLDQQLGGDNRRAATSARVSGGQVTPVERALIGALGESESRFRLIAEHAPTMIWIGGSTGEREFVNLAWYGFTGATASLTERRVWEALIHPDDRAAYRAAVDAACRDGTNAEIELRVRTAGGDWGWILERMTPRMSGKRVMGLTAAAADITAIKRSEAVLARANHRLEAEVRERTRQLERLASTDPLTGLPNRRVAMGRLDDLVAAADAGRTPLSVLYLDLDHFKAINDAFGHAAGDAVLVAAAEAFTRALRPDTLVGRVGGEEFLVLLPGVGAADALAVAERLRRAVTGLRAGDGRAVTVSAGAATRRLGESAAELLRRADEALYRAKRDGRDCCRAAEPTAPLPKASGI